MILLPTQVEKCTCEVIPSSESDYGDIPIEPCTTVTQHSAFSLVAHANAGQPQTQQASASPGVASASTPRDHLSTSAGRTGAVHFDDDEYDHEDPEIQGGLLQNPLPLDPDEDPQLDDANDAFPPKFADLALPPGLTVELLASMGSVQLLKYVNRAYAQSARQKMANPVAMVYWMFKKGEDGLSFRHTALPSKQEIERLAKEFRAAKTSRNNRLARMGLYTDKSGLHLIDSPAASW